MMHQNRTLMRGFFVAFLLLLCGIAVSGLGSVVLKLYMYREMYYTWKEAQSYCKGYHTDLATIYTQRDANSLSLKQHHVWIGLHKNADFLQRDWVWSDGENYNLTAWARNQTQTIGECAAIYYNTKKVNDKTCTSHFFFICHKTEDSIRSYIFVPKSKTWSEAQEHCRRNGYYLAGLEDSDLNTAVREQDFPVWTGLHRDGGPWTWGTGISNYRNWKRGEPGNQGDCVSISSVKKEMAAQNCNDRLPFVCILENVILVKESKSWEKALEYCRSLGLDLLSLQPGDEHEYVMNKVREADTDEVWTGLRFLAGEWLWVNGVEMFYADLPICPTLGQHCGALCKDDTGSVEPRGCLERKNFLCYS